MNMAGKTFWIVRVCSDSDTFFPVWQEDRPDEDELERLLNLNDPPNRPDPDAADDMVVVDGPYIIPSAYPIPLAVSCKTEHRKNLEE